MERNGRLHSLRSRSPTLSTLPPLCHHSGSATCKHTLVTMGPYYCFSGVGGHVRHCGIWTYGTQGFFGDECRRDDVGRSEGVGERGRCPYTPGRTCKTES